MEKFTQLCVWPATLVGSDKIDEFKKFMLDTFNARVEYAEEVITKPTPDQPGTGGRNDLLFYVHSEDIQKFTIPRLEYGISWWEDRQSELREIYPDEIFEKYPYNW